MTDAIVPYSLDTLSGLNDSQAEQLCFNRISSIAHAWQFGFAEIGIIAAHVHETGIWRERSASWAEWMREVTGLSRSASYKAKEIIEALKDIPNAELALIPKENLMNLLQVSTGVRANPAVIEAAKNQKSDAFREYVGKTHPDQHVEAVKHRNFAFEESFAIRFDEVMEMAEKRGAAGKNQCMEWVTEEARSSWEREDRAESESLDNEVTG